MTNVEGIVTQDIASIITIGLTVYDVTGSNVGEISDVNRDSGYMTVEMPPFSGRESPLSMKNLYVPFRLITNIDPRELYVSVAKDKLEQDYANPPARTTTVETSNGYETAVTTEASGYDGTAIVVERVSLDEVRRHIATGDHVYTSDGEDLGTIKQYDSETGWMQVEKRVGPNKHDRMVPVSAVADADESTHEVHLVTSSADLGRMQQPDSANAVSADTQTTDKY